MHSVSMTTRLGLAAVVGTIAVVILAHSKDQAPIATRCKAESCAVGTNIGQVTRKEVPKSMQKNDSSGDGRMIASKRAKSVAAIAVEADADKPVGRKLKKRALKKPAQRLAKKPAERLANKPSQQLVESSGQLQARGRPHRRDDDPFMWRESFN